MNPSEPLASPIAPIASRDSQTRNDVLLLYGNVKHQHGL